MQRLLIRWALMAVSVVLAAFICDALSLDFHVLPLSDAGNIGKLLVGVAVLSLLNATLGKALKLVTLPLSCLTLGFFSLVVNAIVLYVAATLKLGFYTDTGLGGFVGCFVASLLISFLNGMLGVFIPDKDSGRDRGRDDRD